MAYKIKGDVDITRGLGLGSMTTTQRLAYTPSKAGTTVYDSTVKALYAYDGTVWKVVGTVPNNRAFMSHTENVALTIGAVQGFPTVAEVATWAADITQPSHSVAIVDSIVYYVATAAALGTSASTPTYVYHVDQAGVVTELLAPIVMDHVAESINQAAHGFVVTQPIHHDGTGWVASQADVDTTTAQAIVTKVVDAANFEITTHGVVTVTAHGLTAGNYYWLDQAASAVTITAPTSGIAQNLLFVRDVNTLFIDVEQAANVSSTSATPLTNAFVNAYSSFTAGGIQTVPAFSDNGDLTTVYPIAQKLTVSNAISSLNNGITVGANDFTITSSGRYRVSYTIGTADDTTASLTMGFTVEVIKNGTVLLSKSMSRPSHSTSNPQFMVAESSATLSIDLVAGDVIDFRMAAMNQNRARHVNGYTIDIAQLSTSSVVPANTVPTTPLGRASGYRTTTATIGANNNLPMETVTSSNITSSMGTTGLVSLIAGKTYKLSAGIKMEPLATAIGIWVIRTSTSVDISGKIGIFSADAVNIAGSLPSTEIIYTPTANVDVGLYSVLGGTSGEAGAGSYFNVEELPSLSAIMPSSVTVTDSTSSGSMIIGNMLMQWGTLPVTGGATTLTFPVPYSVAPVLTGSVKFGTVVSNSRSVVFGAVTATNTGVAAVSGAGAFAAETVMWQSIGPK